MQNLLLRIFLLVYLFSDILNVFDISAQCPGAATCSEAYTFCSLDELNGFSCSTFGMGDMDCRPGCASGGSQYKRDWWAFVSQGGNVSITLQVGPCNPLAWQFLVMGIWGGCNCTDEVFCQSGLYIPSGGSYTYQVNLKPCKVYYLMLDGGWPIYPCDFTITTSGGGPPKLDPLGFINNLPSGVISPVCLGYCGYKFHVNSQTGNCLNSKYVWTLDDIEVGTNSNDLILDFPKVGDFKLCVKAFGDLNGSICSTEGPICTTVKVSALQDKTRPDATVCSGTQWFSQTIFSSGTYREHFKDINCCEYDSVVNFKIRPDPLPGKVFYFNCDNKPYKDILGRSYSMCEDNLEIILPKSTESYKCDSSFILTAITLDLRPQWTSKCLGSMVQLTPNFNQLKKCNNGESYRFENKWFKKSDNSKILGTADSLIVDAIDDDYCIERRTVVFHGKDSAFCTKVFCENFNESKSGNSIQNINLNACDSANINGQTYTSSTQFTQQLKNIFNCDSIIITELKINPSSSSMLKFNFCDSININKQTYYQSGIFKQNLLNSLGCDSIIQIDLKGYLSGKSILNINSCDSTSVNGIKYFQSGNYSQMLQTTGGCDSILDLNISLFKGTSSKYSFSSCDSIIFNGQSYTKSGDYFQNF
ncbi:MAG: hypothetical protein ABI851_16215, partial [Saprospiraceae bacterium]